MNKKLFLGLALTSVMVSTQVSAVRKDEIGQWIVDDSGVGSTVGPQSCAQGASALAPSAAIGEFVAALEKKTQEGLDWEKELALSGLKAVKMLENPGSFELDDLDDVLRDTDLSILKGTLEGDLFKEGLTINQFLEHLQEESTKDNSRMGALVDCFVEFARCASPEYNPDKFLDQFHPLTGIRQGGIVFLKKFLAGLWRSEDLPTDAIQKIVEQNSQFFPDVKTTRAERKQAIETEKTLFVDSDSFIRIETLEALAVAFENDKMLDPKKLTPQDKEALKKIKKSIGDPKLEAIKLATEDSPHRFSDLVARSSYLPLLKTAAGGQGVRMKLPGQQESTPILTRANSTSKV